MYIRPVAYVIDKKNARYIQGATANGFKVEYSHIIIAAITMNVVHFSCTSLYGINYSIF